MTDPLTFTVAKWRIIADRLINGQVRFSTGSQCRAAVDLGCFIREQIARKHSLTKHTINFGEDWDAVLSIHQASW